MKFTTFSVAILAMLIVAIVFCGYWMYKLFQDKKIAEREDAERRSSAEATQSFFQRKNFEHFTDSTGV